MLVEVQFEEIRDSLRNTVKMFCGSIDIADDAVQHAFLKAFINRSILEMMPPAAMKSWIYAAAKNASIDMLRKRKRLVFYDDDADFEDTDAGDFTQSILIKELVDTLPDELKTLVCLRYYEGFNSSEIGNMLGIPAPTVRGRLRSAINTLRQSYNENRKGNV